MRYRVVLRRRNPEKGHVFFRIHPNNKTVEDLLDDDATSQIWSGTVYKTCKKCKGFGTIYDSFGDEAPCEVCRGTGEIDDSVRKGVSAVRSVDDLINYFRGRDATLDGARLVVMRGEIIGRDWDHEHGAVLIKPSKILQNIPLPKKIRTAIEERVNPKQRRNPAHPVMSYAAAHAWERQAAERGVSEVARSARGFMRAYQRAGTFSRLDPWWQRRRDGFIARHMAQANRGERLWEKVRGAWRPTRRALALIMWAYMPPGRPAGIRQNPSRSVIVAPGVPDYPGKEVGDRISKVQVVPRRLLEPTERASAGKVATFTHSIRTGAPIEAILVEFGAENEQGEDTLAVVDGHHRLAALDALKVAEIPVRTLIRSGDEGSLKVRFDSAKTNAVPKRQNPLSSEEKHGWRRILHVTDTKPAERRYAALADDELFTDKAMKLLDEIDAAKAKARAEILAYAPFRALQIPLNFPNDKMAPYYVVIHRYTKARAHPQADQDRLSRSTIWQASYFDKKGPWRDSKHTNVGQLIKEAQDDFYADTSKVLVIR